MDLRDVLLLGAYGYATAAFGWLYRRVDRVLNNHIKHLEERVSALEARRDG